MKKNPIGFAIDKKESTTAIDVITAANEEIFPRKSVVEVFFPSRHCSYSYYNDQFDLKLGDLVYVEGKLEGRAGWVTKVNYSFKIKIADYKKVIAVADTTVVGDLYFAEDRFVTFDKSTLDFDKVRTWFNAPSDDKDFLSGDDDTQSFPLDKIERILSPQFLLDDDEIFMSCLIPYISLDNGIGRAIVSGSKNYEVEFNFSDGMVSNIKCSCFCSQYCRHEVSALVQLRNVLEFIIKNYEAEYDGYFATIDKKTFSEIVMIKKGPAKIRLGVQ